MKLRNGNILVLESLWDSDLSQPRVSVDGVFSLIHSNYPQFHYRVLGYNTKEELEHSLFLATKNKKDFGILYFSGHGTPGDILLSYAKDDHISLDDIAKLMGKRFRGWGVHFGSCATLRVQQEVIDKFIADTGVVFVSGYDIFVDWLESASLEILYFYYLFWDGRKDLDNFIKAWYNIYADLSNKLGFKVHKRK